MAYRPYTAPTASPLPPMALAALWRSSSEGAEPELEAALEAIAVLGAGSQGTVLR